MSPCGLGVVFQHPASLKNTIVALVQFASP
jgi:hypothetical protein